MMGTNYNKHTCNVHAKNMCVAWCEIKITGCSQSVHHISWVLKFCRTVADGVDCPYCYGTVVICIPIRLIFCGTVFLRMCQSFIQSPGVCMSLVTYYGILI